MQKTVTYHSSAVLYNELLAEAARDAAGKVDDPVVKKWCEGIAKQHDFHAERHRASQEKLERKNDSTDDTSNTVEVEAPTLEPSPALVEAPSLEPMQVEVEIDPNAVDETDEEQVARWQRLEDQAHADSLAAEQQKES